MSRLAVLDNRRIAVTNRNTGNIDLWGPFSGTMVGRLTGHPVPDDDTPEVYAIVGLPDGRLASADDDGSIRLWNVAARKEVGRLRGHTQCVTSLRLLPDGRLLSGSFDCSIRVWDTRIAKEIARLKVVHTGGVDSLLPLPGDRLISIDHDISMALWWDLTSYTFIRMTDSYSGSINDVEITPDGRLLYAGLDGNVHVRVPLGGHKAMTLRGHAKAVTSVCWLGEERIASGSFDNTVRVWNLTGGQETACHQLGFRPSEISRHPNGRLIATDRETRLVLLDV